MPMLMPMAMMPRPQLQLATCNLVARLAAAAAAAASAHLNSRARSAHYGQETRVAATSLDTDFLSLIKLKHVSYRVHRYQAQSLSLSPRLHLHLHPRLHLRQPLGQSIDRATLGQLCCNCGGCGTRLITDMQSPNAWYSPPSLPPSASFNQLLQRGKLKPGLAENGDGQRAGGAFKCHPQAVAASVGAAAVLQAAEGFMFLQNAPRRLTSDPTNDAAPQQ
ncbi:hypothetical protein ACLKA7_014791 [Drosophila subpalustris]